MRDPWILDVASLPPVRSFVPNRRAHGYMPLAPRIQRVVIRATFVNEHTGRQAVRKYLHTIDRSRYTPEKLRELRRTRR